MKKVIHIGLLFFLLCPIASSAGLPTVEERLNIGGIVKEVDIPNEGLWAYVVAEAIIESPPKVVWATLADIDHWNRWLPMTHQAGILSEEAASKITSQNAVNKDEVLAINAQYPAAADTKTEKNSWECIAYEDFNLPWPLKNQWQVKRYVFEDSENMKKAVWRKVATVDNKDDGFWEITPWKDGKTHLRYYYRVKAKRHIPNPVFKTAVSFTINSMIKALRREAKSREI